MIRARRPQVRLRLALLGGILALTLCWISGTSPAHASEPPSSAPSSIQSTSDYCGGWLSAGNSCSGAARWLYEVYGWGDQGGVCVQVGNISVRNCVGAANQGVYSGTGLGYNSYASPYIWTTTAGSNFVHGVALTY